MSAQIIHGDCLDVLREMPADSVDSIVTDPPYGLSRNKKGGSGAASVNPATPAGRALIGTGNGSGGFMGLKWDYDVPSVEIWIECLRVLKPGGYLLAFAGTRTQHRMAVRIEDAGFEIRDMIAWVYGSGFPKSLDVGKALAQEQERVMGNPPYTLTPEDQSRDGWGTGLKPALEPITVARKPLIGTVAQNVHVYSTGAINIDGCRIPTEDALSGGAISSISAGWDRPWKHDEAARGAALDRSAAALQKAEELGRWPANFIHDGSPEVLATFPDAPGAQTPVTGQEPSSKTSRVYNGFTGGRETAVPRLDSGSAARFFYCAKTSSTDRHEGLPHPGQQFQTGSTLRDSENLPKRGNHHPTVKPTDLMRYLCRLVTPPAGVVLDPFCGSGSTGKAALMEAFSFIGIEREAEYVEIAQARLRATLPALLGAL